MCKRIYFAAATFLHLLLGKKMEHSYFWAYHNLKDVRLQHSGLQYGEGDSVSSVRVALLHVKLLERG